MEARSGGGGGSPQVRSEAVGWGREKGRRAETLSLRYEYPILRSTLHDDKRHCTDRKRRRGDGGNDKYGRRQGEGETSKSTSTQKRCYTSGGRRRRRGGGRGGGKAIFQPYEHPALASMFYTGFYFQYVVSWLTPSAEAYTTRGKGVTTQSTVEARAPFGRNVFRMTGLLNPKKKSSDYFFASFFRESTPRFQNDGAP